MYSTFASWLVCSLVALSIGSATAALVAQCPQLSPQVWSTNVRAAVSSTSALHLLAGISTSV